MKNKFSVTLNQIIEKIEELVKEGNLKRIIIKDHNKEIFMEIPVLIGAIFTLAAPIVTAISVLAGFATNFSVEIIKKDNFENVEVYEVKNNSE